MILKESEAMIDFRAALWCSFWLYILQAGDPDLLDTLIQFLQGFVK